MKSVLPNFIFGAILPDAQRLAGLFGNRLAYCCYTPSYSDIPPRAYADCWFATNSGASTPAPLRPRFLSDTTTFVPIINAIDHDAE